MDRLEVGAGLGELQERQEVVSAELARGIDHDLEHHLAERLAQVEMPLARPDLLVSEVVAVAATGWYRAAVDRMSLLLVSEDMKNCVAHTALGSCLKAVADMRRGERMLGSDRCLEDEAD